MPLFACFILPWGLHRIQAQSGTSAGMALHQVFLDNISGTISADSPVTATFTIRDTVSDTRDRYRCLVTWRGSTSILYDKMWTARSILMQPVLTVLIYATA